MGSLRRSLCFCHHVLMKYVDNQPRHKAKTALQGLAPQVRRRCATYGQFATQLVLWSPCVDEICGQLSSTQGQNCTAGPAATGLEGGGVSGGWWCQWVCVACLVPYCFVVQSLAAVCC
jgi:hypothetical protein